MTATATEFISETIRCGHCRKVASCVVLSGGKWWYKNLPPGWLVADTYPPGDDGLLFACSENCARKVTDKDSSW